MTVFSFGSINADHVYKVPHLPVPGETLVSTDHSIGLGGKGANQSVAASKAGRTVVHIGTIGEDGVWARERLRSLGVDVRFISTCDTVTGHANVHVDPSGENMIVVFSGANKKQSLSRLKAALSEAVQGDFFLLQNEVNLCVEAAKLARSLGMVVVYSAAPFVAERAAEMIPLCDVLVMNEVEAEQLADALGAPVSDIEVKNMIVTKGAKGVEWRTDAGETTKQDAFVVQPVDTTGAGDCFIGYVVAALDEGKLVPEALRLGAAAAAIKVTRPGTADAIPGREEVDQFLAEKT